ncbi:MAG TPA: EAL domain-containing protein [Burkholderiaceae bacterium]
MHQGATPDRSDIIVERIDALMHAQPEEALRLCQQILADAKLALEPLLYVTVAERYGDIMDHLGRAIEARNILFAAQQVAQSALLLSNEARLLEKIARGYYSSSEHRYALQYWARCIEIAEQAEQSDESTKVWVLAKIGLAQIYFGFGDYASGLDLLSDAASRIPDVGDPHLDAKVKINVGVCQLETKQFAQAEAAFLQALEVCRRHDLRDYEAESNYYLAKIELATGALDKAVSYLDTALAISRKMNYCWCEANALAFKAGVLSRQGDNLQAIELIKAAQALAIANSFLHMLIQQHFQAAEFAEAIGDYRMANAENKAGRECEQRMLARTASERTRELEEKAGLRPSVNRLLVELSNNKLIQQGDLDPAFRLIARESSHMLAAARASLWLLDPQSQTLVCRCLYLAGQDEFARMESLHQVEYPIYFRRLAEGRPLVAHDAQHHPHTAELVRPYLMQIDIRSMLVVPILLADQVVGTLCFDAIGAQRNWTPDDILHGTQLAEVAARVIAGFEHKMYREQIDTLNARVMRANEMLEERVREQGVSLERHRSEMHKLQDQLSEMRFQAGRIGQSASPAAIAPAQTMAPDASVPGKKRGATNFPIRNIPQHDVKDQRLADLLRLSADWCWEQDTQFRITYVDQFHESKASPGPDFLLGQCLWDWPAINMEEHDWAQHRMQLESRAPFVDLELHLFNAMEDQRWISLSGQPVFDASGDFAGYRGIARDITARKENEDRVRYLASHDALTSLPNRLLFHEFLNRTIQSARRYDRRFAVAFIDLDRFKMINDTLGHEAGDTLLKVISSRLQKCLRTSDVVARLGGDEFVVLLQEVDEQEQASIVAGKILAAVISPVTLMGQECRVTASIGICMFSGDEDEQTMMKNADIAMYRAKEDGKNNFRFYTEAIKSQSLERMMLESNLRKALEFKQFFLHYQAKIDLRSGAITGVEALVRWRHPELGEVQPMQFLPLAEETGLIIPIGRWVLQQACMQNVAWQRRGVAPLSVAVNLSARQFADEFLVRDIESALQQSGMDPGLLELELTESMVTQNFDFATKLLDAIKSLGVKLAIGDFGTGYSSLSKLKHFPIDTLKVDRSFIHDLPHNFEDMALTRAIIDMGKTLKLKVVAEGVESEEQITFLRDSSCDEIQGFHFSKPIDPDQFFTLWAHDNPRPAM